MSIDPRRQDPYAGFQYIVELASIASGRFSTVEVTEAGGLEVSMEIEEYAEGGRNQTTHKLPSRVAHANLSLKRGMTRSTEFWDWIQTAVEAVERGEAVRKNVRIVLLDRYGVEVRGWEVRRALPVKWTGPGFTADSNEVAIETLELAHEGVSSKGWLSG